MRCVLVILFACIISCNGYAWGAKGHAIVGQVAMQFVKPDVKENILKILDGMPVDTAANWMDALRSNTDYDFMKPWHFIDFDKEKTYQPSTDENIVNRLIITYNELRHKNTLCDAQVKSDLLILLHLMGDLHQPLHTGYDEDLGGNKRVVEYKNTKSNLHKFWDEDIIQLSGISTEDCLALYRSYNGQPADSVEGIHPVLWMKETRTNLDKVYGFTGFIVGDDYMAGSTVIVKRQLLIAGLRLAAMLNKIFYTEVSPLSLQDVRTDHKNGITASQAIHFKDKKVTACGKVYQVRNLDKVTFIRMGDADNKNSLNIVIYAKDRANFTGSIEELYENKNICVKGVVQDFKGQAEIVVEAMDDIFVK